MANETGPAAQGKSLSETIREILEAVIAPRPLARRAGHAVWLHRHLCRSVWLPPDSGPS